MKAKIIEGKMYLRSKDIWELLSKYAKECDRLSEENHKLKETILNETTTFCNGCASKDCCPEEDCVLYRIEEIGMKNGRFNK